MPQLPLDFPDYDWERPEPPWSPGAADDLPPPRSRWHGTDHLPEPEPFPPTWCYEPDLGTPGPRLGSDVPRLVDYLTAKGLKPARPRVNLDVHLTDQTLLTGKGIVRSDDLGPLSHAEHQAKTDGVWHVEQPHPGVYLWRSPHQHYFLVTNQGTQPLGPTPAPRPSRLPERHTVVRLDRWRRRHTPTPSASQPV